MLKPQTWLHFAYVNNISFPLVFHGYIYLFICGFYGCHILVIYIGYILIMSIFLWQAWCMILIMLWLLNECTMNILTNILYCSYYDKASMLLSDSQIGMRPISSNLLFWPIDYIFVTCFMKFMSCMVVVRSSTCWIICASILSSRLFIISEIFMKFWKMAWKCGSESGVASSELLRKFHSH